MTTKPKYIWGGLGDMILSIDAARKEEKVNVLTHYKDAKNFLQQADVNVDKVFTFSTPKDVEKLWEAISPEDLGEPVAKNIFTEFDLSHTFLSNLVNIGMQQPALGIHPCRSSFGNQFWKEQGFSDQNFTIEVLEHLVKKYYKDFHIYIFGSQEDHALYDQHYTVIYSYAQRMDFSIWENLALASRCNLFIGNDSVFKTFTASRRIPTFTMFGNYNDPIRDQTFILPYVNAGVMKAYCYNKMDINAIQPMIKDVDKYVQTFR